MIKSGLYSSKQLYICTFIGGPATAGFIIGCNLWATKKKWLALIPVISGIIFNFIILYFIVSAFQFIMHKTPEILPSVVLRHIVAFSFYFLILAGVAALLRFILLRNREIDTYLFPEIDSFKFHPRKIYPVITISLVYLFTILAFNIYLFAVLVFYLFTHFYAYILIHSKFDNKYSKTFLVFFVILACLLPFIDTTGQILYVYGNLKLLSFTYLNLLIGFYVIFVFYVFLFIISFHIVLLINRLARIVPVDVLKKKTITLYAILFALVIGLLIVATGVYLNNNPVISRYSITIPKKSSTLNSLKVISISDLHLKNITSKAFLKKLAEKVQVEKPDIIFFPGDIVETYGNTNEARLNEFIEILKNIKSKKGIYGVSGNHDLPGFNIAEKVSFNKRMGVTMIADSLIELENQFYILGLNYRGNNEKRPIDSLLKLKTKDLPVILLDHAPYCLEDAYENNIDIQLSGHTHYGQIWPLNYITDAIYDVVWGHKKTRNTHLFVSCGVQDAIMPGHQDFSIPVRTGSVSEIMEINIEFR
jgi:hypothetical protein